MVRGYEQLIERLYAAKTNATPKDLAAGLAPRRPWTRHTTPAAK
jgi:hypothetical protein